MLYWRLRSSKGLSQTTLTRSSVLTITPDDLFFEDEPRRLDKEASNLVICQLRLDSTKNKHTNKKRMESNTQHRTTLKEGHGNLEPPV